MVQYSAALRVLIVDAERLIRWSAARMGWD
jgi:hypothetical protein